MNGKTDRSSHERGIEEIEAKQSNTVWPDAMVNSRSVDEFLWKGSPDAPFVQRIGAWIFGVFFIFGGLAWLVGAYERDSWVIAALSIVWFLVGGKMFLNGFRRRRATRPKKKKTSD
jgi:hypothetical protein